MNTYEKKYNYVLKRAKALKECSLSPRIKDWVDSVFPELKESEDEKIRKDIKRAISVALDYSYFDKETANNCLAWLENQGEQKPINKVEPKFKVGDRIVSKTSNLVYRVESILFPQSKCYYLSHNGEMVLVSFTDEQNYRLWTIQDAKDGDVLCTSSTAINEVSIFKGLTIEGFIECYCSYDSEDEYCERKYHFIGKPTPATEEQRDLLFQKMKENGYEWDAEKKELKKIEQKPTACGEEDESTINDIICYIRQRLGYESEKGKKKIQKCENWLKSLSGRVQSQPKKGWNEEDEKYTNIVLAALYSPSAEGLYSFHKVKSSDVTNWFIFLKDRIQPQSQWKPSDEQIKVCKEVYADILSAKGFNIGIVNSELNRMEEQLKKLRGE